MNIQNLVPYSYEMYPNEIKHTNIRGNWNDKDGIYTTWIKKKCVITRCILRATHTTHYISFNCDFFGISPWCLVRRFFVPFIFLFDFNFWPSTSNNTFHNLHLKMKTMTLIEFPSDFFFYLFFQSLFRRHFRTFFAK